MRFLAAMLVVAAVGCKSPEEPGAMVTVPPATASTAAASASASASAEPVASAPAADARAPRAIRAGKVRAPIANAAAALKTFTLAWDEEILPNTIAASRTNDVHAGVRAQAKLGACRDGYARVKSTLGAGEVDLVLFSAIAALDRPGDCWEVTIPTGHWNEILGYLDPKTGALILAWLVPEG